MKQKYIKFAFLVLSCISMIELKAQTLTDAIRKTENEMYYLADLDFKKLINSEPANGNNWYEYGEFYYKRNIKDSAHMMFVRGLGNDPNNVFNMIGQAKVLHSNGEINLAEPIFKNVLAKTKSKNATVLYKIAEAYATGEFPNYSNAILMLDKAQKLEPKNPMIYLVRGDILLAKDPMSGEQPILNYNKAFELSNSAKAKLRIGKLYYRGKNYKLALDYYKEALLLDSTFAPANREMAELYHLANQDKKAVEQYRKYLRLNNDPETRKRFSQFLFEAKLYQEAVLEISNIVKKDTTDFYNYRVLAYSYKEIGDSFPPDGFQKGLNAMNKFMSLAGPDFKYLASDYETYGKLLQKTGNDSIAMIQYQTAIKLDTSKKELLSDIALYHYKKKNYPLALEYFEQKRLSGSPLLLNDYFKIGQANYILKNYANADSAFRQVTLLNKSYILGHVYRGRCNSFLDPDFKLSLAKPFYEKVLEMIAPDMIEKNKREYVESLEYLGKWNEANKDNKTAEEIYKKIQAIAPENANVLRFFKIPSKTTTPPNTTVPPKTPKPEVKPKR